MTVAIPEKSASIAILVAVSRPIRVPVLCAMTRATRLRVSHPPLHLRSDAFLGEPQNRRRHRTRGSAPSPRCLFVRPLALTDSIATPFALAVHWCIVRQHEKPQSLSENIMGGWIGFRSMRRMEARRRKARGLWLRHSQSLASRRQRPSQAKVRPTIQRLGSATIPVA